VTPPTATLAHLDRLRSLGLSNLDLLDVIQSAAFFAWANRLMLTLGEPAIESA
jgi:alkylhydroperoxidase family enzyme